VSASSGSSWEFVNDDNLSSSILLVDLETLLVAQIIVCGVKYYTIKMITVLWDVTTNSGTVLEAVGI
jgi:hypothetical protein